MAIMAALLFGAAILVFVAANWEAMPRLMRVGALFAIILAGYVGGAVLKLRGHPAFAEGAWLIGAAAFGGSIALIGQMYHFSGDEAGAVLIWSLGTALAALMLRSGPLTIAAAALAAAWLFFEGVEFWSSGDFPASFLLLAAFLWLVSFWTGSAAARHLLLLSVILYGALLAIEHHVIALAALLSAVSAGLFALAVLRREAVEKVVRMGDGFLLHCLIGYLTGIALIQFELADGSVAGFALAAGAAFAGIVAALIFAGRESRGLRWTAYAGFGIELCFVYAVMVGTMSGTAGFFLAAAILLGILAAAIIRIEKRMQETSPGVAAS